MNKTFYCLLFTFLSSFPISGFSQNVISYAYDNAGNRISRKVVNLTATPNPTHAKKTVDPAPVEDQLGERTIKVFPNPTKGALAIDINGGDPKDELRIIIFDGNGKQLLNKQVEAGTTPINMKSYPAAYYILRVQAGDKYTEYKIVRQ